MKVNFKNFFYAFVNFLYPNICFICKSQIEESGITRICNKCWSEITIINETFEEYKIKKQQLLIFGIDDFFSLYLFEKEKKIQNIIHQLKYEQKTKFGFELGKKIGEEVLKTKKIEADFLIPIPLHSLKLRERTYNQSEMIAKGISFITKIPTNTKILYRRKNTQSQTHLNFEERQINVSDAFEIRNKKIIENKNIILIDDVITTGATIGEAAKELKKNGAKLIYAASSALTQF